MTGIYVHQTMRVRYADAIAQGYKTIETRSRDTLGGLIGQRVLILRTQDRRKTEIIGSVLITGKQFVPAAEFSSLQDKTLIPPGSKYDCHGRGKWCYTLADPIAHSMPLDAGMIARSNRTTAEIVF